MAGIELDDVRDRLMGGLRCQRIRDVVLFTGDEEPDIYCQDRDDPIDLSLIHALRSGLQYGTLQERLLFVAEDLFIRQQIESVQAISASGWPGPLHRWMARISHLKRSLYGVRTVQIGRKGAYFGKKHRHFVGSLHPLATLHGRH